MKRSTRNIIMLSLMSLLTFNNINASEVKINNTPYKQTQVLKSVLPQNNSNYRGWFKQDTVEVIVNLKKRKKIIINETNTRNEFKILKLNKVKYDIGYAYDMKVIDSNNIKHNINLLFYNNNAGNIVIISNDSIITRYKFIN